VRADLTPVSGQRNLQWYTLPTPKYARAVPTHVPFPDTLS